MFVGLYYFIFVMRIICYIMLLRVIRTYTILSATFLLVWWSKCISMAISTTASRNVALNESRMSESVMANKRQVKTRESKKE